MTETLPIPSRPVKVAHIGAGVRSQTVYQLLYPALRPWIDLVAICDPVKENADAMAGALGVPAYHDIHDLVNSGSIEAAIVCTPVESHHSISVYLSSNGIHNLIETTWSSMVCQAKDMIKVARENDVITRVAENFFRWPIDRFAQTLRDDGYIGRIGRIFCYADHTGYHNNSRWIAFAKSHPLWVQCIENVMTHPAFYSFPFRLHTEEKLSARFFGFTDDFLVIDIGSGHVKGFLGRHARPGHTEWQGTRGTLVQTADPAHWDHAPAVVHRLSDQKLAPAQEARGELFGSGHTDEVSPVIREFENDYWIGSYADTPQGRIRYQSPVPHDVHIGEVNNSMSYGVGVMEHMIDFALAVRGLKESEFNEEDALMSEMMEIGARESALNEGKRIKLPIEGDLESDAITRASLKEKYGVDPMDIEAMLAISYPKP